MLKAFILTLFLALGAYANCCCEPDTKSLVTISGHVTPLDVGSSNLVARGTIRIITYQHIDGTTVWYNTVRTDGDGNYSLQVPMCGDYIVIPTVERRAVGRYPRATPIFDNMPSYVFMNIQFDMPASNFELFLIYLRTNNFQSQLEG